jgi:hypothetical protein
VFVNAASVRALAEMDRVSPTSSVTGTQFKDCPAISQGKSTDTHEANEGSVSVTVTVVVSGPLFVNWISNVWVLAASPVTVLDAMMDAVWALDRLIVYVPRPVLKLVATRT